MPEILNHKTFGDPTKPFLYILHGLFGSLDNWQTLAKKFSETHYVITIDQRNHGHSFHADEMSYPLMAEDFQKLVKEKNFQPGIVLGHSMGGKTAMELAMLDPYLIKKLILVDIAPKSYPPGHQDVFDAIHNVDLNLVKSRKDAEHAILEVIQDQGVALFILKGLYRNKQGKFDWRFNLQTIVNEYNAIRGGIITDGLNLSPTLFIKGGNSNYILEEDKDFILELFPLAEFETIENAGHWVHAEQQEAFYNLVNEYIND